MQQLPDGAGPPVFTRVILMNFGPDESRFWQAYWCILSIMAHTPKPYEIVMVTDSPDYFRWFGNAIRIHPMTDADLAGWVGHHGYFFRTLIKTVELGFQLSPQADVVVYLDTDTVINRSLHPMIDAVMRGKIFMDCREYNCYEAYWQYRMHLNRNKGARNLWQSEGGKEYAGIRIDKTTEMWNTGITALGKADAARLPKALEINDAMLDAGSTHRLVEQIAMSMVLNIKGRTEEVNPQGTIPWITHYWPNKTAWQESITARLATLHHRNLSVSEAVEFALENPVNRSLKIRKSRKWHCLLDLQPIR